ncbi:MAG TPA: alpha/beta hydrolase [Myxococcales bacterium]|jgi:acetyl esterase
MHDSRSSASRSLAARAGRLRRRAGSLAIEAFFEGLSRSTQLLPQARRALSLAEVVRDLPYRPTGLLEHTLDVWRPRERRPGPLPTVLYVHGGGFSILSKETHWSMALRFAAAGYLVFNVNYRLAPRHPFPAALEDVGEAWAWLGAHLAEHGGDPRRVVLAGESAGANLVTALTVATCYERAEGWAQRARAVPLRPAAVIAGCGYLQVSDPGRFGRRKRLPPWLEDRILETSRAYLGRATPDPAGGLELADPISVLEKDAPARPLPPFFAFAGTADPLLDDTRRLGAALSSRGAPHLLRIYPGEPHAFHALSWRPQAEHCWRETFDFLRVHLPPATTT